MELFEKRWKNYKSKTHGLKALIEKYDKRQDLLLEGKVSSTKKNYPKLAFVIDEIARIDPSSNNKYFNWMLNYWIKTHSERFPEFKELYLTPMDAPLPPNVSAARSEEIQAEVVKSTKIMFARATEQLDQFEKNQEIIRHQVKQGGFGGNNFWGIQLKGPAQDINSYDSLLQMSQVNREVANLRAKKEHEKAMRKAQSRQAFEESDRVWENSFIKMIRPNTKHASCYYGKGTKWCISATQTRNHFDSITSEGKAFYFCFFPGSPNPQHPFAKVAMVVSAVDPYADRNYNQPEVDEYYDAADRPLTTDEVVEGVFDMWKESGFADKMFGTEEDYGEQRDWDMRDDIIETIQNAEMTAIEHTEENSPGPNPEVYEKILSDNEPTDTGWRFLFPNVYEIEQGYMGMTITLTVDLQAIIDKYKKEKQVHIQWDPDFPEEYNEGWLQDNLVAWIIDWYKINAKYDPYDIEFDDENNDDVFSNRDELTINFKLTPEEENVYRITPGEFDDMIADMAHTDEALAEYYYELVEDEEYMDLFGKRDEDDEGERLLYISGQDAEYFPGGPEEKAKQFELPFSANAIKRNKDKLERPLKESYSAWAERNKREFGNKKR